MGQSTDAKLGWGIAFESDGGYDYDAAEETNKRLAAEGVDVTIVSHCSADCPMLAIVMSKTYRTAWRGGPRKVDEAMHTAQPYWEACIHRALGVYLEELAKVSEFVEEDRKNLAIEPDALGWYLFSDWS